jgi:hypothetical protein
VPGLFTKAGCFVDDGGIDVLAVEFVGVLSGLEDDCSSIDEV